MNYDNIEVKNYLIGRLVDAEKAIHEVKRFVFTLENEKLQYPNIITRLELVMEEINETKKLLFKEG